jgi:HEAT repeat protein
MGAAQALGQLGERSQRVINGLLSLAEDKVEDARIRGYAAEALGQLGERSQRVINGLLSLAEDKAVYSWVRIYAAQALGQLGEGEKAVQILLSLAEDKAVDSWVRRYTAQALGQLGWSDDKVLDALEQIVRKDRYLDVRDAAWAALLKLANVAADEIRPPKSPAPRRRQGARKTVG